MTISWVFVNSWCVCCTWNTWNVSIRPLENQTRPQLLKPVRIYSFGYHSGFSQSQAKCSGLTPEERTSRSERTRRHCPTILLCVFRENSRHCPPRRGCVHATALEPGSCVVLFCPARGSPRSSHTLFIKLVVFSARLCCWRWVAPPRPSLPSLEGFLLLICGVVFSSTCFQ